MKNKKNTLLVVFLLSVVAGYAQTDTFSVTDEETIARLSKNFAYSQDESIALLKDDYLMMYFRFPTDTVGTLNRFVETINQIIPIGEEKKQTIKQQALETVQRQKITDRPSFITPQTEKFTSISWQISRLPLLHFDNYIPLLAGNVDGVIRANFSEAEYAQIYQTISDRRREAWKAYRILKMYFQWRVPEKAYGIESTFETWYEIQLPIMFDHYGIR